VNNSADYVFDNRKHNLRMAAGPLVPMVAVVFYLLSATPLVVGLVLLAAAAVIGAAIAVFYRRCRVSIGHDAVSVANPFRSYTVRRNDLTGYRMRVRIQPARIVLLSTSHPRGRRAIVLPAKDAIELFQSLGIPHVPNHRAPKDRS
jgi:hypothetical protein